MYCDNQKLWLKLQKTSQELDKTEERFHYMKLEHNNKCAEISKLKDDIVKMKNQVNEIKKTNTKLNDVYTTLHRSEVCYKIATWSMVVSMFLGPKIVIIMWYCLCNIISGSRETILNFFT